MRFIFPEMGNVLMLSKAEAKLLYGFLNLHLSEHGMQNKGIVTYYETILDAVKGHLNVVFGIPFKMFFIKSKKFYPNHIFV